MTIGSSVDDSEAVLLASLESSLPLGSIAQTVGVGGGGAVVGVGAIDQAVLHSRRATILDRVPQRKGLRMAPVAEDHHAEILIVVSGGRTVQDQASESTLCVLQSKVAVVPGRAVLGDGEIVGLGGTRGDGALSNARHTIIVAAVELSQTVPVNGSAVGQEVVGDVNLEIVTPVGLHSGTISYLDELVIEVIYAYMKLRAGNGSVEGHASPLVSIRGTVNGVKGQPVLPGHARGGEFLVVVGIDGIVTPAAARSGGILARGSLTGSERKLAQVRVQTNNGCRSAHGQSQARSND